MKANKVFLLILIAAMVLYLSASAYASAGSNLLYMETDLGGGLWQYDYSFYNTSNAGESLYSVYFYFSQDTSFTGTSLPVGWDGIVWDGSTWIYDFADTYSTDTIYDISAGNSLSGFRFTVDYRAGDVSYDAYFSGENVVSGVSVAVVVPEPKSSILFLTGVLLLSIRCFRKKGHGTSVNINV